MVCSPNDPRFRSLSRRNFPATDFGYIRVPLFESAQSPTSRDELKSDLTLMTSTCEAANLAGHTEEGNSGIPKPFGEKRGLETESPA